MMTPLRRSTRRKRLKVPSMMEELQRCTIRYNKRRETTRSSSSCLRLLQDQDLPYTISDILSDDAELQLHATSHLLKLLSVEDEPPIDEVIKSGAVPRLVEFLQMDGYPQLQHEAARVLKNITTGTSENTNTVIDHGAIPLLVKLLDSPNDQVREQSACVLGNIAGDSPKCRDLVLSCGALHPLLNMLKGQSKLSLLRTGTWTLTNLCEGTPQPPFGQFVSAIPVLESLILSDDEAVLTEACWALSYLCRDCGKQYPDMLASILPRAGDLLMHPSRSVVLPAIRTVVSILHGDVSLIELALAGKVGFQLGYLFGGKDRSCIADEACGAFNIFRERVRYSTRYNYGEEGNPHV